LYVGCIDNFGISTARINETETVWRITLLGVGIPNLENIESPLLGTHTEAHTDIRGLNKCLARHGMEKLGCKNLLDVIGGYLHTVTAATNILVILPQR